MTEGTRSDVCRPRGSPAHFGPRFNAGVPGAVVLQMAATDADCDGILVNSATEEVSLVISKSTARSLVGSTGAAEAPRQRW